MVCEGGVSLKYLRRSIARRFHIDAKSGRCLARPFGYNMRACTCSQRFLIIRSGILVVKTNQNKICRANLTNPTCALHVAIRRRYIDFVILHFLLLTIISNTGRVQGAASTPRGVFFVGCHSSAECAKNLFWNLIFCCSSLGRP